MSDNTVIRSLHDLGLAAWFGGSLMGAVGLNGAASYAKDPTERLPLATAGWAAWTPWQVGAVAVHAIGGIGLLGANRSRLRTSAGSRTNTVAKLSVTAAAAAATAYAGYLGGRVTQHQDEAVVAATEPDDDNSNELALAQQRLKVLQWSIPALTAVLIVLGAGQGEQQRTPAGLLDRFRH